MDSITTVNVLAASASLLPFIQDPSWEGRIAAVFHRSLLCLVPHGGLLHVHGGPQLVSPFSLRVGGEFARVLDEIPFAHRMPVRKVGAGIDMAGRLHLRLDNMTNYQSPKHMAAEVDLVAVELARQMLTTCGRVGGLDQLPNLQTIVMTIRHAVAEGDSAQMLESARHLVGLGPGLTPSGDDFLVGYLRGIWLLRRNRQAASPMLDHLRAGLLPTLADRTTRVGAEFIRHALGGAFAEILDRAAQALLAPAGLQAVRSAINRLLNQGATSGADTLLGLLTCLEGLFCNSDHHPCRQRYDVPLRPSRSAVRG
jgi:hypothetical protein